MTDDIKEEALDMLVKVWKERQDLQVAFPLVSEGKFDRLIHWANDLCKNIFIDNDYEKLVKFQQWYSDNDNFYKDLSLDTKRITREILQTVDPSFNFTLDRILKDTDIKEHLITLFFLVIEFNLKKVLEIGVRDGESSIALAEAVRHIDGHVWSMDLNNCVNAKRDISSCKLDKFWTFTQGDDVVLGKKLDISADLIFIDTDHQYEQALAELTIFERLLNTNGFFVLHDTESYPGVLRAVRDFLRNSMYQYRFYNYFNNNGLVILRRK